MSHQWIRLSVLTGILSAAVLPGAAQDLPSALATCRAEKDDARRLACYDRETEKLPQQPATGTASTDTASAGAAPAVAATPAATPVAAAKSPEERFGYRGEVARAEQDRKKEEIRGLDKLVSTVTGISTRGDGTLVIKLENGQVWAQNRPDSFFRLKVGEQISIEPALLGSYLLISPSKRTARVTRLR